MEMVVSQHIANSIRRQKYDWEEVPENSMGLVPMDQAKWEGSFVDTCDQLGIVQTEEDALWAGAFDTMEDVQGGGVERRCGGVRSRGRGQQV